MKNKVVSINYFKEKQIQEQTDNITEFIKTAEEDKAIEFLALSYIECEKIGKKELGNHILEEGADIRRKCFFEMVEEKINQLKE